MASNSKNLAEMLNTDVTVTATDIADGAVTTAKLADDAVTAAKTTQQVIGRKNLLDNGSMNIWQRGGVTTSRASGGSNALVTLETNWSTDGYGGPDRWLTRVSSGGAGEISIKRTPDVPDGTGLAYSCYMEVTTAYDVNSIANQGRWCILEQRIPTIDVLRATQWSGSSSGKDLTFSFWIKSSLTGTYSTALYLPDDVLTVSENVYCTRPITINSANTWEKKTVTFPANTTSSSITAEFLPDVVADADNSVPNYMLVWIWLDANAGNYAENSLSAASLNAENWRGQDTHGTDWITSDQVNWLNNLGANVYITGLQLETGSEATELEYKSIDDEYVTCQRYYNNWQHQTGLTGTSASNNRWYSNGYNNVADGFLQIPYPQIMRDIPTILSEATTSSNLQTSNYQNPRAFQAYDNADAGFYLYAYSVSADL